MSEETSQHPSHGRNQGGREIWGIVAMILIAAGLWGFAALADEVLEGETRSFDQSVLLWFRVPGAPSDPIGPHWVEQMVADITALGGVTVLTVVTLIVLGYLIVVGKRGAALLVLMSIGGGTVISFLLKSLFDRPRPDIVPHAVEVATASFPSGHAMLSAVIYVTLGGLLARFLSGRRAKVYVVGVAVLMSVAIGISRVYLGVHWPTDVLAGWSLGAAWALLCWFGAAGLQSARRAGKDRPEGPPE